MASRDWLSQAGEIPNYSDITFVRNGLALTNLKPPSQPELLQMHGIKSILSLYHPGEGDLDVSAATRDWVAPDAIGPIEHLLGEGEKPHPKLARVGVKRRVIHPLRDDETNSPAELIRAVELLAELHQLYAPVLVHCRLGASRTPAVVACYIAKSEHLSFREAVKSIARVRSVSINEGLALSIARANGIVLE